MNPQTLQPNSFKTMLIFQLFCHGRIVLIFRIFSASLNTILSQQNQDLQPSINHHQNTAILIPVRFHLSPSISQPDRRTLLCCYFFSHDFSPFKKSRPQTPFFAKSPTPLPLAIPTPTSAPNAPWESFPAFQHKNLRQHRRYHFPAFQDHF